MFRSSAGAGVNNAAHTQLPPQAQGACTFADGSFATSAALVILPMALVTALDSKLPCSSSALTDAAWAAVSCMDSIAHLASVSLVRRANMSEAAAMQSLAVTSGLQLILRLAEERSARGIYTNTSASQHLSALAALLREACKRLNAGAMEASGGENALA